MDAINLYQLCFDDVLTNCFLLEIKSFEDEKRYYVYECSYPQKLYKLRSQSTFIEELNKIEVPYILDLTKGLYKGTLLQYLYDGYFESDSRNIYNKYLILSNALKNSNMIMRNINIDNFNSLIDGKLSNYSKIDDEEKKWIHRQVPTISRKI